MDLIKPQPPPQKTDSPEVWPIIVERLEREGLDDLAELARARDQFGRQKYGTALQVDNGRDPLADLMQEALDAMAYSRQYYEREKTEDAYDLYVMAKAFAKAVLKRIGAR
jgi:ABC-type amino acid transport substrate-binding protein